jgi:lipopolysaccharide transport system permease protein
MKAEDPTALPIRVYTAKARRVGLGPCLTQAWQELSTTRQVVWRLFFRDFVSQFRQRLLGYVWAFVSPLVGIASFVFLNKTGVLQPGELTIPYVLFVFFGVSLWGVMTGTMSVVSASLLTHSDLILRTNIPKIALVMVGMANVVYGQIINVMILAAIMVVSNVVPSLGALALPLMVLPLVALGFGIGLMLSVIGVVARDIPGIVTTGIGLAMYVTPVIYVPKFENRALQALMDYNPLTYLIDEPRSMFFLGTMRHGAGFAIAAVLSCLVLLMGVQAFYRIQDKVAERL